MKNIDIPIPEWLQERPTSVETLPVETRIQELPFDKLTWKNFERLCFRLASLEADVEHCQLYGKQGDKQEGIDIYARQKSEDKYRAYQCKREKNFGPAKIKEAVSTFLAGTWVHKTSVFVLCTQESLEGRQRADELERQKDKLKTKGVTLICWDSAQLSVRLKKHPELVNDFFGQAWVRAFCGQELANIKAILAFEEDYRQQIGSRHQWITPPDFDRHEKRPIDDIYVVPNVITIPKEPEEKQESITIIDFYQRIYRTVLLGDPGSGKSTFTDKLCYELAKSYPEKLLSEPQLTPIHVILRDYAGAKKTSPQSILQFIEITASSKYQLPTPAEKAFEYLLRNGRVVVIFDGLDELLDTHDRQAISYDIEAFCALYPAVPILITSRKVGYEQAPLNPEQFDVFHLDSFDVKQTKLYVEKWFALNPDFTSQEQEQKVNAFMFESQVVPDLRSNPLLLALMCNIYRGEGYLPKNRPDVYKKCADMLFERWDKSRGIHVDLPFEQHIRPTMNYLANWIYVDQARTSGVTEDKLITVASTYLNQRRFDDWDEAEHAARAFIRFCRGRAWVFTDTGTTDTGERLYQFTHRTFLEYFTAAYLVRIYQTPDKLIEFILPKIKEKEWDVVAQLAFQMQNKRFEEAADELLGFLLEEIKKETYAWNILSFAVRSLEFMVPNPRITVNITQICIERIIKWAIDKLNNQDLGGYGQQEVKNLLDCLFSIATDNQKTVGNEIKKILEHKINQGHDLEAHLAFDLAVNRRHFLKYKLGTTNTIPEEPWRNKTIGISLDRWLSLSSKSYFICYYAWLRQMVTLSFLITYHRMRTIFIYYDFYISRVGNYPIFEIIFQTVNFIQDKHNISKSFLTSNLESVAKSLLHWPRPWVTNITREFPPSSVFFRTRYEEKSPQTMLALGGLALFGFIALLTAAIEIDEKRGQIIEALSYIRSDKIPSFILFRATLLARYTDVNEQDVAAELERLHFTTEQKAFIWQWIRREIDLVETPIPEEQQARTQIKA